VASWNAAVVPKWDFPFAEREATEAKIIICPAGYWRLFSKLPLVRASVLWLCYLSVPVAVVLLALSRGTDYIRTVVGFLTQHSPAKSGGTAAPMILDWGFRISGGAACVALVGYLLKYIKRLVGSPLEVDQRLPPLSAAPISKNVPHN
jgi:hypothetical protein